MTPNEELNELGAMVKERREVKSSLACAENKLSRYGSLLEQTAFAMKGHGAFDLSGEGDEFIVRSIPGVQGYEKDVAFPTRREIMGVLKDVQYLRRRLAELDERLQMG